MVLIYFYFIPSPLLFLTLCLCLGGFQVYIPQNASPSLASDFLVQLLNMLWTHKNLKSFKVITINSCAKVKNIGVIFHLPDNFIYYRAKSLNFIFSFRVISLSWMYYFNSRQVFLTLFIPLYISHSKNAPKVVFLKCGLQYITISRPMAYKLKKNGL